MKRVVLTLGWIFAVTLVCSAQTTFYYPQIADGGGWKTTIFLTNPASSGTVTGSITFTNSQGGAFNVSFVDSAGNPTGSGNTVAFQIAGGQTRKFISTGAPAATTSGYATVTATGNIGGTAVFSNFSGANLVGEAGVPGVGAVARQAIFVDLQSGFNTAVAYANPGSSAANVTLRLLNTDAVVATTTQTLNPRNHAALFVGPGFGAALFPSASNISGTMQIESNTPLASIALRFAPNGLFTTLPPVTLAGLVSPVFQWFEKAMPSPLAAFARLVGRIRIG